MREPHPEVQQWNQRGLEFAERGMPREAWDAYSRALSIDPSFVTAYHNRAALLMESQNWGAAAEQYSLALEFDPQDFEALCFRGECYGRSGKDQEALADFERSLTIKPDFYRTWGSRGLFYSDRENWQQALAEWEQARQLAPERPRYWYLVGRSLVELGRPDEAEPFLERAVQLGESDGGVYLWRGIVRRSRGDNVGALSDFHLALQCNPRSALSYMCRGNVHLEQGDLRTAFDDYTRAIECGGDGVLVRVKRGDLYARAGHPREAWEEYEAALRFDPEVIDVYRLRARLLLEAGQRDRAEAEVRKMDAVAFSRLGKLAPNRRCVPAAVLQANSNLYSAGDTDEFCFVLFSFDPNWSQQPERLQALASILKLVKGTDPADLNMRHIAEMITDERAFEHRRRALPMNVTEGATIYYADLLVYRRFLPKLVLEPGQLLAVLAEPGERGRIELAPAGSQ